MVDPQASRFWLAALQSGLLEAPALNACWEGIPVEKRNAPEHVDRRLARQAVQQNHLTLWQAQQLLAGRTSGFRVDRYLLLDLIGHGGMGRVYLARDTRLGRHVALKILSPERMSNPRAIARFQREARVGAQLQHENLVRIYDFGDSQGRYFLVMEYIEGKTIGALISEQGPMPPSTAARLTRQVARGLEHAHQKGLIHRDVNPYNILVTHEGIAKLADLGLAIDLAEEERVTREGATVGTFDYVAPEQARHSHSADIRSDIYSLGCTLYHMIAGQVPFPSPSLPEKLFAHQALEPKPLEQLVPGVPSGLVEIVRRMMRKQPEDRYSTPLQVALALEPFVDDYARLHDGQSEPNPLIDEDAPETAPSEVGAGAREAGAVDLSPAMAEAASHYPDAKGAGNPRGGQVIDSANLVAPSFLTPVNDQEVNSSEDVPLILDLGPEPSLTDSLNRSRSWFGTDRANAGLASGSGDSSESQPGGHTALADLLSRHRWIWPWGILTLLLVILLSILGLLLSRQSGVDPEPGRSTRTASEPGDPHASRPAPADSSLLSARAEPFGASPDPPPDFTVLGDDGQEEPATTLSEAIDLSMGSRGWVVVHNRRPLRIPVSASAAYSAPGRSLKLRSAEGVAATLEVELEAGQSFLKTGSGVTLLLQGLTIVARYPVGRPGVVAPGAAAPLLAPVIFTAGKAEFRHCTFAAEAQDQPARSIARAIVAEGGDLTIQNCWFRGFETAMVIHAAEGTTTRIQQTLATAATSTTPDQPPGGGPSTSASGRSLGPTGAMFQMEFMGGGRSGAPRRLVLDHCTVIGDGLLELSGFSATSPIRVDARGCAIQTRTLIGWRQRSPETPVSVKALAWEGEGNLLEVHGPDWFETPSTRSEQKPIAGDLKSWMSVMKETEPAEGRITFRASSPQPPGIPSPEDVTIEVTGSRKVGADPGQVGPELRALTPAT